jgi:hypothetical protein
MTVPTSLTSETVVTSGDRTYTLTQVIYNPTGALDGGSSSDSSNSFFDNKGAVAGVFVVVGLAVVAILTALGVLFYRKRRRQRLDREVTAAAVAASAAASRAPLDEEDMHSSHPASESYRSTMTQYSPYPGKYSDSSYIPGVAGTAAGAAALGYEGQHYSDNPHYTDNYGDPYSDQFETLHEHPAEGSYEAYGTADNYGQGYGHTSPDQGYYYDAHGGNPAAAGTAAAAGTYEGVYDPAAYASGDYVYDNPFQSGYDPTSLEGNSPMDSNNSDTPPHAV